MYAEECLKAEVIQEAMAKSSKSFRTQLMTQEVVENRKKSVASAWRTLLISETCFRYTLKLSAENEKIADLLLGLIQNQRNSGFGL
jgi:putative transposase